MSNRNITTTYDYKVKAYSSDIGWSSLSTDYDTGYTKCNTPGIPTIEDLERAFSNN